MNIKFNFIKTNLLAALLVAFPAAVQAQFNFTTNNGALTVTAYNGSANVVVIPNKTNGLPIISIGSSAFYGSSMTGITLGTNITSIAEDAFFYCPSLASVNIGKNITNIEGNVFLECTSLTTITADQKNPFYSTLNGILFNKNQSKLIAYPDGILAASYTIPTIVTSVGSSAFNGSQLVSLTIPKNVASSEAYAFGGCFNLLTITVATNNPIYSSLDGVLFDKSQTTLIQYPGGLVGNYKMPNSVVSIGSSAFDDCRLTGITMPNSIINIGFGAFNQCENLTTVSIPDSVIAIGSAAFDLCYSLTNVIFGTNVTSIGDNAFEGCPLTNIIIPASVTWLGDGAFFDCAGLTSLYFEGNAPDLSSDVFDDDNDAIAYYLPGTTGWTNIFGGLPTALWLPQLQTNDNHFGIQAGQFGFMINWASGRTVWVEAATNLLHPAWIPVATNILTIDSSYFSDLQWTNYPSRFYRLSSP